MFMFSSENVMYAFYLASLSLANPDSFLSFGGGWEFIGTVVGEEDKGEGAGDAAFASWVPPEILPPRACVTIISVTIFTNLSFTQINNPIIIKLESDASALFLSF